jgi:hypothetical protein
MANDTITAQAVADTRAQEATAILALEFSAAAAASEPHKGRTAGWAPGQGPIHRVVVPGRLLHPPSTHKREAVHWPP